MRAIAAAAVFAVVLGLFLRMVPPTGSSMAETMMQDDISSLRLEVHELALCLADITASPSGDLPATCAVPEHRRLATAEACIARREPWPPEEEIFLPQLPGDLVVERHPSLVGHFRTEVTDHDYRTYRCMVNSSYMVVEFCETLECPEEPLRPERYLPIR